MERVSTHDHVLFNEAIYKFRNPKRRPWGWEIQEVDGLAASYILLSFCLDEPIAVGEYIIDATQRVNFNNEPYAAFPSRVTLPPGSIQWNAHLPVTALSALFSFITDRPIKALRDSIEYGVKDVYINPQYLALHHPILVNAPGSHNYDISKSKQSKYAAELNELYNLLHSLPWPNFIRFLQAIRLIQLAHNNLRDDSGLAFYLVVSAIESIAQQAVSVESLLTSKALGRKTRREIVWEQKAADDPDVASLYESYQKMQGNTRLTDRFIQFILVYCPSESWDELENIAESERRDRLEKYPPFRSRDADEIIDPIVARGPLPYKDWIHPGTFPIEEQVSFLKDLYSQRSKYSHEGAAPPHRSHNESERFFEYYTVNNNGQREDVLVVTYHFLTFLAKRSIMAYLREVVAKQDSTP